MNIEIVNARENNLKGINISIPKKKLIAFTGVSGSGKSTVVFDIIHAESQRQYLESMSSYSRIGMPRFSKSNVDMLSGISPTIVIDQRQLSGNPRSTVGTITETYTYLRLLFSRFGYPRLNAGDFSFNTPSGACGNCKGTGKEIVVNVHKLLDFNCSLNEGAIRHRTYKVGGREWNIIQATNLFDMEKKLRDFSKEELDALLYSRPIKCSNTAVGFIQNFTFEGIALRILRHACDSRGLGIANYDTMFTDEQLCHVCKGARVNNRASSVKIDGLSIVDLSTMEITELLSCLEKIKISDLADEIMDYLTRMLHTMVDLGLGYLSLSRSVATLSNGESQRLKLARQLNSSMSDIIYILDEPTSGLHKKDIDRIVKYLKRLVEKDNTVIVVEHNRSVIKHADYVVDLGPMAGKQGGEVVYHGNYEGLVSSNTITSRFLKEGIRAKDIYRKPYKYMSVTANRNNLYNLHINIPKELFVCITGVSGSGKSSLVTELVKQHPECIVIDQSKVGTSSRSNAATYVGVFDDIRKEFAKASDLSASMFAFNGAGCCKKCKGLGYEVINMHFLGDVKSRCDECNGKRYLPEVLDVKYKGKDISEVLEMTIAEAYQFFANPSIKLKLEILLDIGLGYLTLGQPLDTLSGGEVQRIKLARGLSKKGSTYVLDEPTRGLHMYDVQWLLELLERLVNMGNTIIVVEHNMDVIKNADYIIDLGPEGGKLGGNIVACGTPVDVMNQELSYTGKYLKQELEKGGGING